MTRYELDPDASTLAIHARSSLHPINTDASGVTGAIDLSLVNDDAASTNGPIDLAQPVTAGIEFELKKLSSGNPLYDIETERRIDVRRFPLVNATITNVDIRQKDDDDARAFIYSVRADLAFHGQTNAVEGDVRVRFDDDGQLVIDGEQTIDVRDWGISPPRLGLLKVSPDVRVLLHVIAHRVDPA